MLTPRAKYENILSEKYILPSEITVSVYDDVSEKILKTLQIFFESAKFTFKAVPDNAYITLVKDSALSDKTEHYKLTINDSGIMFTYADFMGGRNAAASLYQLIRYENGAYYVLGAEIDDWADNLMRGVLLDPARNFLPAEDLKNTFLRMALDKLNTAHLHLLDYQSYVVQSKKYPELNSEEFGYYKTEELTEIIAFGRALGIECIPEIEIPAHSYPLKKNFPFLKCETETVAPSIWVMCVSNERFYEFFSDIISEIAELFPGNIIHIGTDEFCMYDHDDFRGWPTWYDCKHCKKLAKELGIYMTPASEVAASEADGTFKDKGIAGMTEMFYYMVKRMHAIITKAGKRMMMWNDNIDIAKPCDLPRDILIHFWRIAAKYRGPREGCSMEKFLEAGFDVINSHYPQTYIEEDFYKPEVPLNTWAPKVYPPHDAKYKKQILGGWPSAWDNYDHFEYTLPSSLAFYADRLWDESAAEYGKEFNISITRLLLGTEVPENFDVFSALGSYFLPRRNPSVKREDRPYGYPEKVTISADEVAETEKTLRSLAESKTLEGSLAGIYADCVNWVYNKLIK